MHSPGRTFVLKIEEKLFKKLLSCIKLPRKLERKKEKREGKKAIHTRVSYLAGKHTMEAR